MIQPRAKKSFDPQANAPKTTALSGHSHREIPKTTEVEPPEDALQMCEAPERRQPWQQEAPDAGDGRNYHDDRGFTHGRSRG
jgi:hypothetical protein